MRTTRIAATAAAVVLAISSAALANGADDTAVASRTETASRSPIQTASSANATTPGPSTTTAVGSAPTSTAASTPTSTSTPAFASLSSSTPSTTATSTPGSTQASTPGGSTSTTVDDRTSTTMRETTSTTMDDSDDGARSLVALDLRTHTVGEAGTVTVEGMRLIAVDANPGWTVEINEASSARIKVEFERGEIDAEFELRSDGELRIRTHD